MHELHPPQETLPRTTLEIRFSFLFEWLVAEGSQDHTSLSADIESCARRGLSTLSSLEDVYDLPQSEDITRLVEQANKIMTLGGDELLPPWKIAINTDLVDEIEQILTLHEDELAEFGLKEVTPSSVLVLLAVSGALASGNSASAPAA